MGNVINKDNDTINWNNVKTDNFTSNNRNQFLSDDSKLLISKLQLNLPPVQDSESDGFSDIEKIFNKYQSVPQNTKSASELSDTSPFISSEMYNYLMTKNNINQQDGGAWGKGNGGKGKQHGGAIEEDSSTSSTSSSNDSPSAKPKGKGKGKKDSSSESDSGTMSGGSDNLSYISSSAHTDSGSYESEESGNNTTQSGGDSVPNENGEVPPSSINTSDINMISESS